VRRCWSSSSGTRRWSCSTPISPPTVAFAPSSWSSPTGSWRWASRSRTWCQWRPGLRDVSLLAALPNITIVQPANSEETNALLRWAIEEAGENVAIRLAIGPSPRRIELPRPRVVSPGRGSVLRDGTNAVLFAYGPVMLHEALTAAEFLGDRLRVVNMPWLNRVDTAWLADLVEQFEEILVLEDHAPVGALGDALRRVLGGRAVTVFGVEGWPVCGTPAEALRFHGLDGASLADRITLALGARTAS
jgi:transketolase